MNQRRLDNRVIDRYIAKGELKESEYRDYLKKLPNEEGSAEWVQVNYEEAEVGELESQPKDDSAESPHETSETG